MKKTYESPEIHIVHVCVEKGFALSFNQSGMYLQDFYYDSSLGEEEEDTFFN